MSGPRKILKVKEVNESRTNLTKSLFGVGVGISSLSLGNLIGRSCLLIYLIFSNLTNREVSRLQICS